jgi:CubicO group peptidase (beta-lactamase class C family)
MSPSAASELGAFIAGRMNDAHVPGLAIAILHQGNVLLTAGYGYADLAQKRPMQPETLLNLASITKTLTCTALMQLWEQGKFALDDDVNTHLTNPVRNPKYPQTPITFRNLLTHTSSIGDGPAYGESYACGDPMTPLAEWLGAYLSPAGVLFARSNFHQREPGAQFQYTNVGYGLIGHLIETLSGRPYADYVREEVFEPLGMSSSRFSLAGMDGTSHATPYTFVNGGELPDVELRQAGWKPPPETANGMQVPHCLYSFGTPPDGLARSSAADLSKFLAAYLNGGVLDGKQILQPATVAEILSDQHVPAMATGQPPPFGQGLAWRRFDDPEVGTVWGHTGGDPGVSTLMTFRPADRRGVVILLNGNRAAGAAADIARRVFGMLA